MKIKIKSSREETLPNKTTEKDLKPLINAVAQLIEWEIKDVQEKEERSKEVPQKVQH